MDEHARLQTIRKLQDSIRCLASISNTIETRPWALENQEKLRPIYDALAALIETLLTPEEFQRLRLNHQDKVSWAKSIGYFLKKKYGGLES